jgi:hypothetical protein
MNAASENRVTRTNAGAQMCQLICTGQNQLRDKCDRVGLGSRDAVAVRTERFDTNSPIFTNLSSSSNSLPAWNRIKELLVYKTNCFNKHLLKIGTY